MKQNVGILDTAIRSIIACVVLALAIENMFSPAISIALATLGLLLFVSSSLGVCLLYKALGIDTYPDFKDESLPLH